MDTRNRVNEDEFDWNGDHCLSEGIPFTGVGYLLHPNGSLMSEAPFRNGFRDGQCREWYSNGQMKREWVARRGQAFGIVRAWHENGVPKSVGEYEFGIELKYSEWDNIGRLVVERTIDEASELFNYLQFRRRGGEESNPRSTDQ